MAEEPSQKGVAPEQTRPHIPQFCESLRRSTHVPLHVVDEVGQAQEPATQLLPAEQTRPHAPQLPLSLRGSMHVPPQSI